MACPGAKCEILDDETKYLAITERKAEWSGPRQFVAVEGFTSNDDLKVAFNFSKRSPEPITAYWKVKVTTSDKTKNFVIYTVDIIILTIKTSSPIGLFLILFLDRMKFSSTLK